MPQDDHTYGFSEQDARSLLQDLGGVETTFAEHQPYQGSSRVFHFQTPAGGIPGMVGLQMGSASCTLLSCSSSGLLATTTTSHTVYNPSSNAVAGSEEIVAARNGAGLFVAILEDC